MKKLSDIIVNYSSIDVGLNDVYLIAEAGVNHEGSIEQALRLVDAAAEGGEMPSSFRLIRPSHWLPRTPQLVGLKTRIYSFPVRIIQEIRLLRPARLPRLYEHCLSLGIEFLSTPFDVDSAKLNRIYG